jgi:hypothetical protein
MTFLLQHEKILHHNKVAAGHFHTATCPSIPHLAVQDFFFFATIKN